MNQFTKIASIVGGVLVLLVGIVLKYAAFPTYLRSEIIKAKQLLNGSEALERWVTLPMPLEYKVFIFNVTNSVEVSQGALPILQEMGPYVYDEYIHKENLKFSEDSISYSVRKIYHFNQKKSGCRREEDLVTSINVALLGTAMMVENIFRPGLSFLNKAIPYLFPGIQNIFWTVRIKDLLFNGITINCTNKESSAICSGMDGETPNTMVKLKSGDYSFAFFKHKNNTLIGPFVENRGIRNISNLGHILSFEGKTELDVWQPNSTCNELRGTDSSIYPPFFKKTDSIYIFEPDVCASLAAVFDEEKQVDGMDVMRFVNAPENFGDPAEYESSKCRCKFQENNKDFTCLKPGVIDLTDCQGVPVVSSLPHFYLADTSYKSYVEGLTPNKADHETYIDMEPATGVPLKGHKRLQLNIFLRKIVGIELLNNVSQGLLPMFWLDEGVELNEESLNKLRSFYSSVNMVHWFAIFIIVLGCVIIFSSVLYLIYMKKMLCFKTFSSNKVRTVLNLRTLNENKEEEANKTAHYTPSNVLPPNNGLNLKFLSNNYPNIFPNEPQIVARPQNINVTNS